MKKSKSEAYLFLLLDVIKRIQVIFCLLFHMCHLLNMLTQHLRAHAPTFLIKIFCFRPTFQNIYLTMVRLNPSNHFALMWDMSPCDFLLSFPIDFSVTFKAIVPKLSLRFDLSSFPGRDSAFSEVLFGSSLITMDGGTGAWLTTFLAFLENQLFLAPLLCLELMNDFLLLVAEFLAR